ncbi:probable serine/threonine-protein kinase DDB_G0272092 [Liolophura sinensis]|uniref:probable serine/threonine-protein kinase DDB_G0272092 n=1 Tax=Liolophura sinensis TaxID=3198878 RepID=UPI003158E6B3
MCRWGERIGLFECLLESQESRHDHVYMWRLGDSTVIITGRPQHVLPPQPSPEKEKRQSRNSAGYKEPSENTPVSFYQLGACIIQRYYYGLEKQEVTENVKNAQTTDNHPCVAPFSLPDTPENDDGGIWWTKLQTPTDLSKLDVPILSHRHLSSEKTVVGEGAFGTVSLTILAGIKQVVVKSFYDDHSTSEDILQESKLLYYLSDTGFVPQLFGVSYGPDFRVSIVQEYCAQGVTLYDVLYGFYNLSNEAWMKIIRQLANGVKAIHCKAVLLNDLKEDNILVDCQSGNFEVKFIDFGLSTFKESRIYHVIPEERHMRAQLAPEVIYGQPTRPSSDIYSLGKILDNISYQCGTRGLREIAEVCLGPVDKRPSIDSVIQMISDLD